MSFAARVGSHLASASSGSSLAKGISDKYEQSTRHSDTTTAKGQELQMRRTEDQQQQKASEAAQRQKDDKEKQELQDKVREERKQPALTSPAGTQNESGTNWQAIYRGASNTGRQ